MDVLGIKYDYVISLGHDCGAAMYMARYGLRRASFPFDWMGTEWIGIAGCVDLMIADFPNFLKRENLSPYQGPEGDYSRMPTVWYKDHGANLLLVHDVLRDRTLDEQYSKIVEKYARRRVRLQAVLRSPVKVLFVCWNHRHEQDESGISPAWERLRRHFPTGTLNLVYMQNVDGMSGLEEREIAPGIVYFRGWFFNSKGEENPLGDLKLNGRVFGRIRAKGRIGNLIRNRLNKFLKKLKTQSHLTSQGRLKARLKADNRAW